jgi:hypothetical protein
MSLGQFEETCPGSRRAAAAAASFLKPLAPLTAHTGRAIMFIGKRPPQERSRALFGDLHLVVNLEKAHNMHAITDRNCRRDPRFWVFRVYGADTMNVTVSRGRNANGALLRYLAARSWPRPDWNFLAAGPVLELLAATNPWPKALGPRNEWPTGR